MILTYMGKPLTDYHCPICGGKNLHEYEFSDYYFTCENCGKMPLLKLKQQRELCFNNGINKPDKIETSYIYT